MTWKLKRTRQCEKCPWRVDVDPHDIPNGYCTTRHEGLENTISDPDDLVSTIDRDFVAMACHETDDAHCVGWLMNQLGPGNHIGMRLQMTSCENSKHLKLVGEQHTCFADTLP